MTKLTAVAALASSLLLIPLMQGSAQASPLPGVNSHFSSDDAYCRQRR